MKRPVLLALIFCLGCIKDPPTGLGTVVGRWTLRTVDGGSLPFTTTGSGANQTQITGDAIVLLEGNGFNETTDLRVTVNGQATTQTTVITGTYGFVGNSIVFRIDPNGATKTGVVDNGGAMTIPESGFIKVYRK